MVTAENDILGFDLSLGDIIKKAREMKPKDVFTLSSNTAIKKDNEKRQLERALEQKS